MQSSRARFLPLLCWRFLEHSEIGTATPTLVQHERTQFQTQTQILIQ